MTISDGSPLPLAVKSTSPSCWADAACELADQLEQPYRSQLQTAAKTARFSGKSETFHYLQAQRESRTVGVACGQDLPGRMSQIRNVILAQTETDQTGQHLINALDEAFEKQGAVFSMMVLEEFPTSVHQWLEISGYDSLGHVETRCQPLPTANWPASVEIEFVSGAENKRAELISVIEATYQQSLDCPKLQKLRSTDDLLNGYRGQGLIPTDGWSFVHHGNTIVGCLLMTAFSGENYWELSYLGLIPEARGQGWGAQIVQQACSQATKGGADLLIATVDRANQPALAIYEQLGFMTVERNTIYAKRIKISTKPEIPDS